MADHEYLPLTLADILIGEPLPGPVYVNLDKRFVLLRDKDDVITREIFERLEFKQVDHVFVIAEQRELFQKWSDGTLDEGKPTEETKEYYEVRDYAQRKTGDLFSKGPTDKSIKETIQAATKVVSEVTKLPYAASSLKHLQKYARGTAAHSVNVSVVSTYVALQMGYSHQQILGHIAGGAILHDIGKILVKVSKNDSPPQVREKMKAHPTLGAEYLRKLKGVPDEVIMIVAQHHEQYDGKGYPDGLRANQIYDLARIVSIINVFDELVGDAQGTLRQRQLKALHDIDNILYKQFDPNKLEKAVRILKWGI